MRCPDGTSAACILSANMLAGKPTLSLTHRSIAPNGCVAAVRVRVHVRGSDQVQRLWSRSQSTARWTKREPLHVWNWDACVPRRLGARCREHRVHACGCDAWPKEGLNQGGHTLQG